MGSSSAAGAGSAGPTAISSSRAMSPARVIVTRATFRPVCCSSAATATWRSRCLNVQGARGTKASYPDGNSLEPSERPRPARELPSLVDRCERVEEREHLWNLAGIGACSRTAPRGPQRRRAPSLRLRSLARRSASSAMSRVALTPRPQLPARAPPARWPRGTPPGRRLGPGGGRPCRSRHGPRHG